MPNIHVPGTNINWNTNLVPGVNVSQALHNPTTYQNSTPSQFYPDLPTTSSSPSAAPKVLGATTSAATAPVDASAPAPDPFAQWGGQDAFNRLVSGFSTQKQGIFDTANEAADNAGIGLHGSILDFIDQLKSGQRSVDTQASKNELAKLQGTRGILDMVGRGIRSSGVMLANRNAGDSSAAGALANAYGQQGRAQLSNVGNQYELGNKDVQLSQDLLGTQQAAGVRRLSDSKTQAVNGIVSDARTQFAKLDAAMASASLPDRIAIEQEKENVRSQVLQKLQQYDQMLQSETSQIAPTSIDARREEAQRLASAGTDLGADAFNFTDQIPGNFQNSGPFASELPIFTSPRARRTA